MKRKQHHLTDQQIQRLDQLAQNTGLSAAEHVRRAIDEYLERMKRHDRDGQSNPAKVD